MSRTRTLAARLPFYVFADDGELIARCAHTMHAAAVIAAQDIDGWTIRLGRSKARTLWTEGRDGDAGESFDQVALVCTERLNCAAH